MSIYKKVDSQDLQYFASILRHESIRIDEESLQNASRDETEDISYLPELVLFPYTVEEVSLILTYCSGKRISVTTRGGGTGLAGGAIPVCSGVVLSMVKMDKILSIDTANHQVTVEAGVVTEVLQETLLKQGLCYPPDPSSRGSCTIGGNISTNAGGARAVKYGVTRDYVLNLEIVLADGSILWTGANTLKYASGYPLTQIMIGSEGTLAVVTKIVLKITTPPLFQKLMWIPCYDLAFTGQLVNDIINLRLQPSALELMEKSAIIYALEYLSAPFFEGKEEEKAYLMVELDGQDELEITARCEALFALCDASGMTGEILFAETASEQLQFWQLRRSIGWAVKHHSIYKEEDTVVPRAYLPELLAKVKDLGSSYGFQSVCYGHAGDGNLHINIIKGNLSDEFWEHTLPKAIIELFTYVVSIGGAISGEHGIGLVQKQYLPIQFSPRHLEIFSGLKSLFDPHNVLNPEKILGSKSNFTP